VLIHSVYRKTKHTVKWSKYRKTRAWMRDRESEFLRLPAT